MEKELMISVIVPVYNGEKTVSAAVDSILCQMDGQIELILVNDGSKDASGTICDEYAAQHPNIHVIHKPNGGTSSAKNMGIGIAKGRYITFLDCDDIIEKDAFGQIIPILLEYRPDCLDFGWKYVDQQGNYTEHLHGCRKNILMSREELETVILPPLLNLRKDEEHFIYDFCCSKVFRAEIIRTHQVRFDEDKRAWEDRTFLLRHLKHCQNYYAMDKCFYVYFYTPNSLSQRYDMEFLKIILANYHHYRELFEDRFEFDTQYAMDHWAKAIENMIFRSLEETENQQIIRANIIRTLQDEQVRLWYSKRTCTQPQDRKISDLVVGGKADEALTCYEKLTAQKKRQKAFANAKARVREFGRRILGR